MNALNISTFNTANIVIFGLCRSFNYLCGAVDKANIAARALCFLGQNFAYSVFDYSHSYRLFVYFRIWYVGEIEQKT